jgi:hypothetical protein
MSDWAFRLVFGNAPQDQPLSDDEAREMLEHIESNYIQILKDNL